MRFLVVPSALAALILIAACGGGDTKTVTERVTVTESTPTAPNQSTGHVLYFLLNDKVAPVWNDVSSGPAVARAALNALLDGGAEADYETAVPFAELRGLTIANGVAEVDLSQSVPPAGQAQIVYTLTQFPTVERVRFLLDGAPQGPATGRAAYERFTPAILVESPLPGETVEPGFEVTGTANTFEATFNYELKDAAGKVLSKDFVTATSGSGTRGTFRFTVPYEIDEPQNGTLVVFELSAADGSRTHESEIPLELE